MPSTRGISDQRQYDEGRSSAVGGGESSEWTEDPDTPLEDRSKQELYNRAEQLNLSGRSLMNKRELIEAIRGRS